MSQQQNTNEPNGTKNGAKKKYMVTIVEWVFLLSVF